MKGTSLWGLVLVALSGCDRTPPEEPARVSAQVSSEPQATAQPVAPPALAKEEPATDWDPQSAWADRGRRDDLLEQKGDAPLPGVFSAKPAAPPKASLGAAPDGGRLARAAEYVQLSSPYVLPPVPTVRRTPPSDRIVRVMPPWPSYWPTNARYRSNYLPGRGYLDGLVAAWPSSLKPLLPQRRPPVLPPPTSGRSLDLVVDQQYPLVPKEGIESVIVARLRAAVGDPRPRPPLRLHLVLDASGSMKGANWAAVCAAVRDVAYRLTPSDLLSVVIYNDTAQVLSPPIPGGPEAFKVAERVCAVRPTRETNIYAGLAAGYGQARSVYDQDAVNRVLLLSDGMPTRGPTDSYMLTSETAVALGEGITTSAVGIGQDFDALIMGRIALEGGGNFHFVRDRAYVGAVFTDELEVLTREAAEVVEVRVRLDPRVRLLEVVGSEPLQLPESLRARGVEVAMDRRIEAEAGIPSDRTRDMNEGVRFLIPSFRMGDEHAFVLRLYVPKDMPPGRLATVELRYKDMLAGRNVMLRAEPFVARARDREQAEAHADHQTLVAAARARAACALQRASEYLHPINLARIRTELYEAARALSDAAGLSGDRLAQDDADRLRRLADAAGSGDTGVATLATAYHYCFRTFGLTAW